MKFHGDAYDDLGESELFQNDNGYDQYYKSMFKNIFGEEDEEEDE